MKYRIVQLNNDLSIFQEGQYNWGLQTTKWDDLNTFSREEDALDEYDKLREIRNLKKIKRIIKEEK